jgi:hypothetical protein
VIDSRFSATEIGARPFLLLELVVSNQRDFWEKWTAISQKFANLPRTHFANRKNEESIPKCVVNQLKLAKRVKNSTLATSRK